MHACARQYFSSCLMRQLSRMRTNQWLRKERHVPAAPEAA